MSQKPFRIGVIGLGAQGKLEMDKYANLLQLAESTGVETARSGAILICGGLGGVMEAAARGAKQAGGLTIGILPGDNAASANPYIDIPIVTDMGHARNVIIVNSSQALIAIGSGYGTLSEISLALKIGRPVIGLQTWDIDPRIIQIDNPAQAVQQALALLGEKW